jgi:predicted RNA-binding protein with PIN domain
MRQRFLIDGYNLLHAHGLPRRAGPGALQLARQRLLALVRHRYPDAECTVVFDGKRASSPQNERGITVLFSNGPADDLIAELLAHDSAPRTLSVVTSDHAVQTAARRRQASVIDADRFLRDLESRPAPAPLAAPEKPAAEPDTERWLEAFGAIDRDPQVQAMQEIERLGRKKAKKKRPS